MTPLPDRHIPHEEGTRVAYVIRWCRLWILEDRKEDRVIQVSVHTSEEEGKRYFNARFDGQTYGSMPEVIVTKHSAGYEPVPVPLYKQAQAEGGSKRWDIENYIS